MVFGFSFYLSGISWITNSLTFDENFKVLIPFALILIPLFLSLFVGFTTLVIGQYLKLNFSSILIFSASLAFSDYLRANILTGFPWNLWAYSTTSLIEIIQVLNFIGIYSYNLIVITIFVSPIIIFYKINKIKKLISLTSITFIILIFYIFGNYEINKNQKIIDNTDEKAYIR